MSGFETAALVIGVAIVFCHVGVALARHRVVFLWANAVLHAAWFPCLLLARVAADGVLLCLLSSLFVAVIAETVRQKRSRRGGGDE